MQQFILMLLSDRLKFMTKAAIAYEWASRDANGVPTKPGDPGRREFTRSEYESVRRACDTLHQQKLVEADMVSTPGGRFAIGYAIAEKYLRADYE